MSGSRDPNLVAGEPQPEPRPVRELQDRISTLEQNLREQKELFDLIVTNSDSCIAVVCGPELRFLFVNPTFQAMNPDMRMVGHTYSEVFPQGIELGWEARIRDVLSTGEPWVIRSLAAATPGKPNAVWEGQVIRLSAKPTEEALVMLVSWEVTEERRAEQTLRLNKTFLRRVIDATPNMIFARDWNGRFALVNKALARRYGTTAEALLGKTDADFNPNRAEVGKFLADDRWVMNTGRELRTEEQVTGADGESRWYSTVKVPLMDDDGSCRNVLGVATDITDRKRAEEELQAAKISAERAKAAAEEASHAKDHFLAVLSHELRTPLAPVVAALAMLQNRQDLDSDTRENLEMIRRNVAMEAQLIEDLLDVTRLTRGKVELQRTPVRLHDIVRRAVEVVEADLRARHMQFDFGCTRECIIDADPMRLEQVFWNLLRNSIKFTPQGGYVGISCRSEGESAVVEIKDSGEGIAPEAIPRIFNPFEQAERTTARQFGGLGLGLTISRALVEMHGGTIEAESEGKGKGATFRVRLPLISQQSTAAPAVPAAEPANTEMAAPLRILLVEDHADTARIMGKLLVASGHKVMTAGDIASALTIARKNTFHLILTDLGLPDGNGIDLVRTLRSRGMNAPAIALSGFGQEQDIEQTQAAGFQAHLTKPVSLAKLNEAIAGCSRGL